MYMYMYFVFIHPIACAEGYYRGSDEDTAAPCDCELLVHIYVMVFGGLFFSLVCLIDFS